MNGAMILATPLVGGHYFIDVFAGIAVAVVSILLARQIAEFVLSVSGSELISISRTTGPVVGASRD
jgi:membrane-associated phospholipid phosphatase